MAKYDLIQATETPSSAALLTTTFSAAPTLGDVVILMAIAPNRVVSGPPDGFTLLDSWVDSPDGGRLFVYAKIAGASESATYSLTLNDATNASLIGLRIEGPIASLSALTLDPRETITAADSIAIRSAAVSLAQAGGALAFYYVPYGQGPDPSTWNNSFSDIGVVGPGSRLRGAYRKYSSANAAVQTVATPANTTWGGSWMLRITEAAADALAITTEPSNSWDDEVIRPAIVVQSSNASFTGNVTLAKGSGSGTLAGTLTVAAVGGIATFNNVRVQGSGLHTLIASASGHTSDTSAAFKVATGTGVPGGGSGAILLGGGMQRALKDGETIPSRKRLFFDIRKTDGTPWDGDVAGVKAKLSNSGAGPSDSNADIVRVGGASHYVELTNGEAAAAAPGDILESWVPAGSGRLESTHAYFEITADDVSAAGLTATQLRDTIVPAIVRAANGLDGYEYEKQPESNRVKVVLPGGGTFYVTAEFDSTSPGITKIGGV